ncbi:hypothetical protein V8E36_002597 [Tilletia maclaganii]
MTLSNRRLLRACRTTHITSYANGSSFSSTQGGTSYLDYTDGTTTAFPANGPAREEPNHAEEPELSTTTSGTALVASAQGYPPHQVAPLLSSPTQLASTSPPFALLGSFAPPASALAPVDPSNLFPFPAPTTSRDTADAPPVSPSPTVASKDNAIPIHTGFAAADITLVQAYGKAARNAVRGTPGPKMTGWFLDRVLVYDPACPPGLLRNTKPSASASAFYLDSHRQQRVKEVWRCRACDALRTTDPNITNNLQ